MAVNTSTRCAPPLHRSMSSRLPRSFFPQTSSKLCFPRDLWIPRLTSVCSHLSGSDGLVSKLFVRLEEPDSSIGSSCSPSSSSAIDFLTLCHRLQTTKRKGWINHGIKGPESIVDHMYRMALMALIVEDILEHGKVVDEFGLSTAAKFQTDAGKSWAVAEIISRRKLRLGKRHNYLEEN